MLVIAIACILVSIFWDWRKPFENQTLQDAITSQGLLLAGVILSGAPVSVIIFFVVLSYLLIGMHLCLHPVKNNADELTLFELDHPPHTILWLTITWPLQLLVKSVSGYGDFD
jgi:hypothetical protein